MAEEKNIDKDESTVDGASGMEELSLTQEELDSLVEKRLARQKRALTAQFEERMKELINGKESEGAEAAPPEQMEQLKERASTLAAEKGRLEAELAELRQERLEEMKRAAVVEAARRLGAISPEDVFRLVAHNIHCTGIEEGSPVFAVRGGDAGEGGEPARSVSRRTGGQVSVEAYVAGFLKERPYLVAAASGKEGSGSGLGGGSADPRRTTAAGRLRGGSHEAIRKGFARDRQLEQQGRFWHGGADLG